MTSPGHDELHEHEHEPWDQPERDPRDAAPESEPTPEERLEALLAERRREIEEHARRFEETVASVERREELVGDARTSVERVLRLGAADLEAREADLAELAHGLDRRERRVREEESRLARRRGELGAVELKRAAVEQREQALAARETELAGREETLAAREAALTGREDRAEPAGLLFVPGPQYRLVEAEQPGLVRGGTVELEDETYVVARLGPSPLPGDERRCAYLVRGPRGDSSGEGST
jgi:hypothetical protein